VQSPVLELVGLKKTIKKKEIIKGISLTIKPGEILGFIGPNGSGKTTTIRMIVGLIKPTEGTVKICGHSISNEFVKAMSNVGCIIESPEMYKFLTGMENLLHFARMDQRITVQRVNEVVEIVGLKNRIKDKVSTYSLGMRQRLGIAQALLCKPRLLILDEPVNGLDPAGISEFRNLIKKLAREEGMAIFVSSHLLSEAQMMCDRVAIIKQGSIVQIMAVKDIVNTKIIEWQLNDPVKAVQLLKEKWGIDAWQEDSKTVSAPLGKNRLEEINEVFIKEGIKLKYSFPRQSSLEDIFLDLTEGDEIA
jgi:ABC-2 type transport system ATP-binding protein